MTSVVGEAELNSTNIGLVIELSESVVVQSAFNVAAYASST